MNNKTLALGLFVFLSFQFSASAQPNGEPPDDLQRVVALVDGQKITYGDIRVRDKNASQIFKINHRRDPTPEELAASISEMERSRLIGEIHDCLRNKVINELGITSTKEEARSFMREIYPGMKGDPNGVLDRERDYFQQLASALREVLKNPEMERGIYESRLKNFMEHDTWKEAIKYYGSIEKIELIEKNIPKSVEDIYKSGELSGGAWVIENKLTDWITKDVKVSEAELKGYYASRYTNGGVGFEELKPKIKKELISEKRAAYIKAWWQEQYKRAKIEIKDEQFKDILKMLIPQEIEQSGISTNK